MFVLVERPLNPRRRAVEEVDLAPEHLFEVGFHAGVFQGRDEGIENVCDGDRKALPIWHRARIGLIKGAVAVKLQLVERMGGLGCGVGGFIRVVVSVDRHLFLASGPVSSARHPARPSWAAKAVTGDAPSPRLRGRNACGGGRQASYLFRDAKRGLAPRGGNSLPAALDGASPLTAACPSLEGRSGVGWMRFTRKEAKVMIHTHDRTAGPLPPQPLTTLSAMRLSPTGVGDPQARSALSDAGAAPPCRSRGDHR